MWRYTFGDDNSARYVRYRGVFDFNGLYQFIANWIKNDNYDFYEKRIVERAPYTIYEMEGRKIVDYYAMYLLLPSIWVTEDKQIQVIKNGRLKNLSEGRLKIIIDGGFITDYDGDFESSSGDKKIEQFLNSRILYHEILLTHLDYMDYYLVSFMTALKQYLGMEVSSNAY